MTEADLLREVMRYAKLTGWYVYRPQLSKHLAVRKAGGQGWPDLMLIRRGRLLAVELKSEHGELSKEQKEVLVMLHEVPGVETFVFRPSDRVAITRVLA